MQKTIGGDRLGSGKKMKVELHGFERSTHDLSYLWRSTMAAGTLVPFLSEIALPGDTFDINLGCEVMTHPTVGPLFGSYKVQLDVFQAPLRLYNSALHNNELGIGMKMNQVQLPKINLTALELPTVADGIDMDNAQINPSCILSYLGIRGIGNPQGTTQPTRSFNAVPLLAYWEIFKNYYANKQEELAYQLHTPGAALINTVTQITRFTSGAEVVIPPTSGGSTTMVLGTQIRIYYTGTQPIPSQELINTLEHGWQTADALSTGVWTDTGTYIWAAFRQTYWGNVTATGWKYIDPTDIQNGKPELSPFPLSNIDEMRQILLATPPHSEYQITNVNDAPYGTLCAIVNGFPNILASQEGLAIKTYQSDLLNNWIQTEWIDGVDGISNITAIDTSDGFFTLDTLNLSKKVYDMLNRIAVSGGTYDDWLDAVYAHDRYTRCETPMYMGGLSKELIFQEVVSTAGSGGTDGMPLGSLAGQGRMAQKHKGGEIYIKIDEPSYIIGIVSLTPRIDYSQGNKWDVNLKTLDDLHKPNLDEIGFQELITEQMAWWDTRYDTITGQWIQKSAGKQPAWINYMTNINQVRGNFAIPNNEMFMTLNRRYEPVDTAGPLEIKDLTTYIDPSKFNFIFAETSLDAQNFWTQIAIDMTARRKMSAKIMPNL